MTDTAKLEADVARLTRERDLERKHAAKLMRERDHARGALSEANARLASQSSMTPDGLPDTLELTRTALRHASFALDNIVALDEEDEGKDGGSQTCQHAKRTVDRALVKVEAAIRAMGEKGGEG